MVSGGASIGERRLIGAKDCRELVEAAALAMCIALDAMVAAAAVAQPVAVTRTVTPASMAGGAKGPTAGAKGAGEAESVRAAQDARASGAWQLSFTGLTTVRVQPGVAWGGALGLARRGPSYVVGAEFRHEQLLQDADVAGGLLRTSIVAASLVGCYRVDAVHLCAVGTYGARNLQGVDFMFDGGGASDLYGIGPRVAIETIFGRRIALSFRVEAMRELGGTDAQVDGQTVWRSPSIGLLFGLSGAVLTAPDNERR